MNNSATSKLFLFCWLRLFGSCGVQKRNGPLYVKVLLFSQQFCHLQKIAFHISAICGTDLAKESAIFTGQLEAVGLANFPKRDSWEKTANLLLLGHPSRSSKMPFPLNPVSQIESTVNRKPKKSSTW